MQGATRGGGKDKQEEDADIRRENIISVEWRAFLCTAPSETRLLRLGRWGGQTSLPRPTPPQPYVISPPPLLRPPAWLQFD